MSKEKKYNVDYFENLKGKELEGVNNIHSSRVAFMIVDGKVLYLENSTMSHYEWAMSLGLDTDKFNKLTRGYARDERIVFYKGNFEFDEKIIEDAKIYANEIARHCNMVSAEVYAGVNIGKPGQVWLPKIYLFTLELENENNFRL